MNIILTGSSSGIGESILKELLLLSDVKILTLSRRKPNINSEKIRWIECDLSNEKEIEIIKTELEEFKCDVLINNAGSGKVQDLIDLNYNDILKETNLNLIAPMLLTKIVSKNMIRNKYGRIINISSISGVYGTPYLFTYSATKAGLMNFTQSSANYFKNKNITVNSISPGGINTQMAVEGRKEISRLHNMDEDDYQKQMMNQMGVSKLIDCTDVAKLVIFLINTSSINGQNINICGLIER